MIEQQCAPHAATTEVPVLLPLRFSLHNMMRSSVAPSSTSLHGNGCNAYRS